ncbi:hypothetical protein V6N12_042519 [Hibiscus sabdariffa]|uniref:Uncharacterized protein n=1 Tax=Hibiscus sabdariffa TaxID=183260 RepID=A0ABR2EF15_9ROSI
MLSQPSTPPKRVSIADMATIDGEWRWEYFEHLLLRFVLLRIAAIKASCPFLPRLKGHHAPFFRKMRLVGKARPLQGVEDVDHLLQFYPSTLLVWLPLIKLERMDEFCAMEFHEWIRSMVEPQRCSLWRLIGYSRVSVGLQPLYAFYHKASFG